MIPWIDPHKPVFPPVSNALDEPNGLLCAGANLDPETLVQAYSSGLFPWYNPGEPVLWWSPDPRMVLFPAELHLARRLKKSLRKSDFVVSVDRSFAKVMRQCAAPRADCEGTWISDEMFEAYCRLHQAGHAHSVEIWQQGELVGGLYGVLLGRIFFGESMFSRVSNASKAALLGLVRWLAPLGCPLIDCQVYSPHLETLGAREIPRTEFCDYLNHYTQAQAEQMRPDPEFCHDLPQLLASEPV